jgi:hypothetical protein
MKAEELSDKADNLNMATGFYKMMVDNHVTKGELTPRVQMILDDLIKDFSSYKSSFDLRTNDFWSLFQLIRAMGISQGIYIPVSRNERYETRIAEILFREGIARGEKIADRNAAENSPVRFAGLVEDLVEGNKEQVYQTASEFISKAAGETTTFFGEMSRTMIAGPLREFRHRMRDTNFSISEVIDSAEGLNSDFAHEAAHEVLKRIEIMTGGNAHIEVRPRQEMREEELSRVAKMTKAEYTAWLKEAGLSPDTNIANVELFGTERLDISVRDTVSLIQLSDSLEKGLFERTAFHEGVHTIQRLMGFMAVAHPSKGVRESFQSVISKMEAVSTDVEKQTDYIADMLVRTQKKTLGLHEDRSAWQAIREFLRDLWRWLFTYSNVRLDQVKSLDDMKTFSLEQLVGEMYEGRLADFYNEMIKTGGFPSLTTTELKLSYIDYIKSRGLASAGTIQFDDKAFEEFRKEVQARDKFKEPKELKGEKGITFMMIDGEKIYFEAATGIAVNVADQPKIDRVWDDTKFSVADKLARGARKVPVVKGLPGLKEPISPEYDPFTVVIDDYLGSTEAQGLRYRRDVDDIQRTIRGMAKDWGLKKKLFELFTFKGEYAYGRRARMLDRVLYMYFELYETGGRGQNALETWAEALRQRAPWITTRRKALVDAAIRLREQVERDPNSVRAQKVAEVMSMVRTTYADAFTLANQFGIISRPRADYQARSLFRDGQPHWSNSYFNQSTSHRMERTFPTVVEAWQDGWENELYSISGNMERYLTNITTAVENKRLIMKMLGVDSTFITATPNPLMYRNQDPIASIFDDQQTEDGKKYRKINIEGTSIWRHFKDDPDDFIPSGMETKFKDETDETTGRTVRYIRQSLYLHPEVHARMFNLLSKPDILGTAPARAAIAANTVFKKIILQSSLFHHFAFLREYFFATPYIIRDQAGLFGELGVNRFNVSAVYKRGQDLIRKATEINRAGGEIQPFLDSLTGQEREWVGIIHGLLRNGMTIGRYQDWSEGTNTNILREEWLEGMGAKGMASRVVGNIRTLANSMETFLFKEYGAGLKVMAALASYKWAQAKMIKEGWEIEIPPGALDGYSGAEREQRLAELRQRELFSMVAKYINAHYGGLNLKKFQASKSPMVRFWFHPMFQFLKRLLLLAPDWTESQLHVLVKAVKSDSKIERALYGKMYKAIIARAGTTLIMANLLMAMISSMTGDEDDETQWERMKSNWENNDGFRALIRTLEVDVTAFYRAITTEPDKEIGKRFNILGHLLDPLDAIGESPRLFRNKMGIFPKVLYDAFTGTNYKGEVFTSIDEMLGLDYDKGRYRVKVGTRRVGDPKFGRLKGKLSKFGQAKPLSWEQVPSFALNEFRGFLPIPLQELLNLGVGHSAFFEAAPRMVGLQMMSDFTPDIEDDPDKYFNSVKRRITREFDETARRYAKKGEPIPYRERMQFMRRLTEYNRKARRHRFPLMKRSTLREREKHIRRYPTPDME